MRVGLRRCRRRVPGCQNSRRTASLAGPVRTSDGAATRCADGVARRESHLAVMLADRRREGHTGFLLDEVAHWRSARWASK